MSSCVALGCEQPVPADRIMCRSHWFLVPKQLRVGVWKTFKGEAHDYEAAVEAAIAAVADAEAKNSMKGGLE